MNRYTINASNLNTEQQSVVQRAIIAMLAVASGVANYRIHFFAQVAGVARASASQVSRTLARSLVTASAVATSVLANQNRYWARLGATARASIESVGTVYVRDYIQSAANLAVSAVIWAKSLTIGRGIVSETARAVATITGKHYYTRWLGQAAARAYAQAVINFETRKQIPYDENAPDIRTMPVPSDNRTMMVT